MGGEPLMDSERVSDVKKALAGFPGLAGVAVVEHGAGQADECLIGYVVPSGPGLDLPELHAYARKTLHNASMPAAIMVIDEIPVTPATARQEILRELFAHGVRVARCGTCSDFFDRGGRSVEAMLLAGSINAG